MAIYESDIGSHGFDFVAAVTEKAVNAVLKTHLTNLAISRAPITVCFKMMSKEDTSPELIDYEEMKRLAQGTDPFQIPDDPTARSAALLQLANSLFLMGFRARIGLPQGTSQQERIVQFVNAWSTAVNYEILFSELSIVGFYAPPGGSSTWVSESQSPASGPWIVKIPANLTFEAAASKNVGMSDQARDSLRRAMGNSTCSAFSIQQFLLNLSGGIDTTATPEISGISHEGALSLFARMFPLYLSNCLLQRGAPILWCPPDPRTDPDPSPWPPRSLRICIKPYLDSSGRVDANTSLATLNYLLPSSGNSSDPAAATPPFDLFTFRWNWVSPADVSQSHGIAALSRRALAQTLHTRLLDHATRLCIKSTIEHNQHTTTEPMIKFPTEGNALLSYSHSYTDKNKDDELISGFALDVCFRARTCQLVVEQHQSCHLRLQIGTCKGSAQLLDLTRRVTFELAVGGKGDVAASVYGEEVVDKGERPPSVGISVDVWNAKEFNRRAPEIARLVNQWNLVGNAIPTEFADVLELPGASVFAYRNLVFSDLGDLVVRATYGYPG